MANRKRFLISFICICLIFCIFSAVNAQLIPDGLYQGEFIMHVDNPLQCAPHNPGITRVTNMEEGQMLFQNVVFWPDEIVIGEKVCITEGTAILCPPEDQILDMSIYGFDAIVTNAASNGAGQVIENGFKMNYSMRRMTCEGSDCDVVGDWMFGPDTSFPCNIGPWRTKFLGIPD